MSFSLLVSLAVISILIRPSKPVRLQKPAVLLVYFKKTIQIFGMFFTLIPISWTVKRFLPAFADLLPGLMLLMTYMLGKLFQYPEPELWMIFCVWVYLAPQEFSAALSNAAAISLGVSFFEWAVDGIRFRMAFTGSSKSFSALPGILLTLSLVALVFSCLFLS